tara:strand:- start:1636 stop:1866 length:231 start_codon:yes stop_codon:yes gene_type:complete
MVSAVTIIASVVITILLNNINQKLGQIPTLIEKVETIGEVVKDDIRPELKEQRNRITAAEREIFILSNEVENLSRQ